MLRSVRRLDPEAQRMSAVLAWRVREKRIANLRRIGSTAASEPEHDAARFLDGCLRGLATEEARCRMVLGRLLAVFGRKCSLTRLGFVRLADYARERLGISGSEADLTARVAKRLDVLPSLRSAFLEGTLSWTKARIVARVASADTEERWLEAARSRTVAELEKLAAGEGAVAAEEVAAVREDDGDEIECEPPSRFRILVPGWTWLLFRRVVDLARSVAGEGDLPVWKCVETVNGEALGMIPAASVFHDDVDLEMLWRASRRGQSATKRGLPPFLVPRGDPDEPMPSRKRDIAGWLGVAEEDLRSLLPEDVDAHAEGAEDATPPGLDRRLRAVVATMQRVDARIARALRLFAGRRLFDELGYLTFDSYVTERLGMSLRKARTLLALDRAGGENPTLGAAWASGKLSSVRATALLPVVRSGGDAAPWVERASQVPVRRLIDEVSFVVERFVAEPGDSRTAGPPPLGGVLEPVQIRVSEEAPRATHRVEFWGPATVVSTFERLAIAWGEPEEAPWKGLARLLAAVTERWLAEGRRHRDPIVRRDGYRCVLPICGSRRNLQVHHLIFRSAGGTDEPFNVATVCAAHHHQCIHRGTVRARGLAPDAIEWDVGLYDGEGPLLRLRGEVYADALAGR